MVEVLKNICARCRRYVESAIDVTDALHRKCFNAECDCACSDSPAVGTQAAVTFSDGQDT